MCAEDADVPMCIYGRQPKVPNIVELLVYYKAFCCIELCFLAKGNRLESVVYVFGKLQSNRFENVSFHDGA